MTREQTVKVTTLGRFSVRVGGKPLAFGRKTPLRPLALLKYLASQGGAEISVGQVAEALWPDKGALAALRALAINLHRLRRLVGSTEIVIHRERHIAIDLRRVWCDAEVFERTLDQATQAGGDEERVRLIARALALYRGDFLTGEPGEGWVVATRERLRARYALACAAQARQLAAAERGQGIRARRESVSDL